MREQIVKQLNDVGFVNNAQMIDSLTEFLSLLIKWNEVHNLTAVTKPHDMIERHLVESLALSSFLQGNRIADVGSGAGIPGIPLAITEPQRQFTLIESRAKRASFLRHVSGKLGLKNILVEHVRVEELSPELPFETVCARAVAPLKDLLKLTKNLFRPETVLLALTGESFEGDSATLEGGYFAQRASGSITELFNGSLIVVKKLSDSTFYD
ncbi:MAG: 16S rRNA (guanine(527)-N(7))-methyltransferase RsmG [Rhodospirillaceae bacterium]|nr:16S rRNA (guanine(527)-N(7))-methyltransferase RsmG [Rhodospirillaceae bacterium]|tara:strand:- start:828 stop:1460 length:633 start_codon:yes stop_codon:yes gene_type:complete